MSTTLPSTTIAVTAHAAGDLRVEEKRLDPPAPNAAVVQIAYGGICGSDLHYWQDGAAGESILKHPLQLGHEVSGVIAQGAADGSGPATGTPVTVHPATPGGTGARFPADRPNLSPECAYLGSAARVPHNDGAFSSFVNLPTRMLRALPANVSLRTAALVEPASNAWHAVTRAGTITGRRALVIGCGPIGSLVVAVLKRFGAEEIVAVDVHQSPRQIATAVGADRTLSADAVDEIAAVEADLVFECSGSHQGLASAVHGTMRGGRLTLLGLPPAGPQPALISMIVTRELELVGSFRFNDEIDEVITALADNSLQVDPVITHEFPATESLSAFRVAADAAVSGKVLLRF